jgi:uncharacterized damage-inducible protein DinB
MDDRVDGMDERDVLIEAFDRLPALVHRAVAGLTPGQLTWAPAPGANTIGWLVWHLARVQDDHVADLREADQVWVTGGWAKRFGLADGAMDTGYGHQAADVARLRPETADALTGYYDAVHEQTRAFLGTLDTARLDEVVDEGWDPPVTLGVRLVSVLGDDTQHVGQAAYLRGLVPGQVPDN